MHLPPIDKRALVHTVRWTPKKILLKSDEEENSYIINNVRLGENITLTFHKHQIQETNIGNWRLWWDAKLSGKVNDEQPKFAIGDVIEFMPGSPIYPKITQIHNVIPQYDVDGTIHHLEIILL